MCAGVEAGVRGVWRKEWADDLPFVWRERRQKVDLANVKEFFDFIFAA